MPLQKPLDSADLDLSLEPVIDKYLEYAAFTKLFIAQCENYGLYITYEGSFWRLIHIGMTEGQIGELLGNYKGTAQDILAIALDLYVKVANESA